MIATRSRTMRDFTSDQWRCLQLTGLLLAVVAIRGFSTAGAYPVFHIVLIVGVATLAGATFLRRRWQRAARLAVFVSETIRTRSAPQTDAAADRYDETRGTASSLATAGKWR